MLHRDEVMTKFHFFVLRVRNELLQIRPSTHLVRIRVVIGINRLAVDDRKQKLCSKNLRRIHTTLHIRTPQSIAEAAIPRSQSTEADPD
jgi:hypothetical protein